MVPRRRSLLILLALSLVGVAAFSTLALKADETPDEVSGRQARSAGSDPTSNLGSPAEPGVVAQRAAEGGWSIVWWGAALASSLVLLVTLLFVGREVRVEKMRLRGDRLKRALADDMKEYRRARRFSERRHT